MRFAESAFCDFRKKKEKRKKKKENILCYITQSSVDGKKWLFGWIFLVVSNSLFSYSMFGSGLFP